MYQKQIYKTALFSSPIIALYGIAPVFFMTKFLGIEIPGKGSFWQGWIMLTTMTLFLWGINFYVISVSEKSKSMSGLRRHVLSYILVIIFAAFSLLISGMFDQKRDVPLIFPFIICLTNNTIILIICESIISKSNKAKAENELAILKVRSIEAEHQQLIQQLQPHFLFNALSTLKSLIKSDAELAEDYLIKLSDFLRYTVSTHKNKLVLLSEELQFAKDYISLQQIRFEDSFHSILNIPDEILNTFSIPIYALQTLVENSIKHNAFTEENPMNLKIDFMEDSLVISNNKIPKQVSVSNGVGLRNLNERYLLTCGEKIEISDLEQSFSVTIKLIKNH